MIPALPTLIGASVEWTDDLYVAPSGAHFKLKVQGAWVQRHQISIEVKANSRDLFTLFLVKNSFAHEEQDDSREDGQGGLFLDASGRDPNNQELKKYTLLFQVPNLANRMVRLAKLVPGNPCPLIGIPRQIKVINRINCPPPDDVDTIIPYPELDEFHYPKVCLRSKIPFSIDTILFQGSALDKDNVMNAFLFGKHHPGYKECLCKRKASIVGHFAIECLPQKPKKIRIKDYAHHHDYYYPEFQLPEEFYTDPKKIN